MSKREMLHIRVSREQRELLKWKANKAEMSVSEFIRRRLSLDEGKPGRPVMEKRDRWAKGSREVLSSEAPAETGEVEVEYDNPSDEPNQEDPLF